MKPLRPHRQFLGHDLALANPDQRQRLLDGERVELLDGASSEGRDPRCTFVVKFLAQGERPFLWRCRASRVGLLIVAEVREVMEQGETVGPVALAAHLSRGDGHQLWTFRNAPDDHPVGPAQLASSPIAWDLDQLEREDPEPLGVSGGGGGDFGQLGEEAI
jgi:hypothetical protein